jgi:hypothetical protein
MSEERGVWYDCEVRAYSVHDSVDKDYHAKHGYTTSTGTDGRIPGGMAGPKWLAGKSVRLTVGNEGKTLTAFIDDTGPMCRESSKDLVYLELRFATTEEAKAWGVHHTRVYVY